MEAGLAVTDCNINDPNRPFDDQICRTARQRFTGQWGGKVPLPS